MGLGKTSISSKCTNSPSNEGRSSVQIATIARTFELPVRVVVDTTAPRVMGVLRPLKVVIENYPEGQSEELETANLPDDPSAVTRRVTQQEELDYIRGDVPKNMLCPTGRAPRTVPREGERDGVDYHFVPHAEFVRRREAGEFVESATYGGPSPTCTPARPVNHPGPH